MELAARRRPWSVVAADGLVAHDPDLIAGRVGEEAVDNLG
jgi:hypothetical protein